MKAEQRQVLEERALRAAMRFPGLALGSGLTSEDFTNPSLRNGFQAIPECDVFADDGSIPVMNLVAVTGELFEALQPVTRYEIGSPESARLCWRELRESAIESKFRGELRALFGSADAPRGSELVQSVMRLSQGFLEAAPSTDWRTVLDCVEEYRAVREHELAHGDAPFLSCGLPCVDRRAPIVPGELTILMSGPGIGKTTLLQQWMRHVASQGKRSAFFSGEMTSRQLGQRELHAQAGRPLSEGFLTAFELSEAYRELRNTPSSHLVRVQTKSRWTPAEILANCLTLKREPEGLDLVGFDHVRMVDMSGSNNLDWWQKLQQAAYEAKRVAKEAEVPLIMICHLSRKRAEGDKPTLEMLRGAGEDDADNVFALWRKEDGADTEIHFLKCRQTGYTGSELLEYSKRHQTYCEAPEERQQAKES